MVLEENSELIPTRASLLERLRQLDEAGWREFFDTYWKLIYRTARTAGLSALESEEVVQTTVIAVARLMPGFKYRPASQGGSFKAWLLQQTKWRIADHFRALQRHRRVVSLEELSFSGPDGAGQTPDPMSIQLELLWDEDWEKNLVDAALEQVRSVVDPKHYQIFFLKTMKNWPALKVAKRLKVSLPQVYTVSHRISKQVQRKLELLRQHES